MTHWPTTQANGDSDFYKLTTTIPRLDVLHEFELTRLKVTTSSDYCKLDKLIL